MKINLIKFVKQTFFESFNNYIQSNSYESSKYKFVELHLSLFTEKRKNRLNIQFTPKNVNEFIKQKEISIKKYITNDESIIVKLILSSMPPQVCELFYLNNMSDNLDDLKTYSLSIDAVDEYFLSNSENNSIRLNRSKSLDEVENVALVELANLEKGERNQDNLFLQFEDDLRTVF